MTHTSTYVTLEISQASFDDIKIRLEVAGVLDDYLTSHDQIFPMLLFGTVGFIIDSRTQRSLPDLSKYDIRPFASPVQNAALVAVDKAGEEALKNDPNWREIPVGTACVAGFTDEEALRQSNEILYCRSHDFGLCKAHRDACGSPKVPGQSLIQTRSTDPRDQTPCQFQRWPAIGGEPWCAVCLGRLKP